MRTVYWNTHSPNNGLEFSGECRAKTSTRIELVTASDIGANSGRKLAILTTVAIRMAPKARTTAELPLCPMRQLGAGAGSWRPRAGAANRADQGGPLFGKR